MSNNRKYVPEDPLPWHYKYEHMAVTTDCVILTYEDWRLKVLLVRRGGEPYKGMWAFPGGFLKMGETAEEGALRELREETGLEPSSPIVQLGVFSEVDRDPRERVITIAFYALVKPSEVVGGDDADEAAWFAVDAIPPLAFDHTKIFDAAMERLRRDIHFQPVGFDLLDDTFTIPDLQRLYEAILGVKFDRRNFQRKILSSGILEEVPMYESASTYGEPEEPVSESIPMPVAFQEELSLPKGFPDEAPRKKSRPGRKGLWFSLNRKRYEEMKEDGGKMEF